MRHLNSARGPNWHQSRFNESRTKQQGDNSVFGKESRSGNREAERSCFPILAFQIRAAQNREAGQSCPSEFRFPNPGSAGYVGEECSTDQSAALRVATRTFLLWLALRLSTPL